MPIKRKKSSGKKKSRKSSEKESTPKSALLIDPIMPEIIPPPPLPFETLVGLLAENPMSEKDIDGIRVSSYVSKQLTAQEIRDLHFVFDIFDVNKDGYLNETEFMKALRCLGMQCTLDQARRVFHRAAKTTAHEQALKEQEKNASEEQNIDGDHIQQTESHYDVFKDHKHHFRGLNVNQFLEVVISRQGDAFDYQDELAMAFKCFDINGTGQITADSLSNLARSIGYDLSAKSCQEMINVADRDGDGIVDESEFMKIMLQTNLYSNHLLG